MKTTTVLAVLGISALGFVGVVAHAVLKLVSECLLAADLEPFALTDSFCSSGNPQRRARIS